MLKIGITGGIGTGKSTVCRIFETLGIPVFYADQEAKNLSMQDAAVVHAIKKIFGEDIYAAGTLRTKEVAAIVFQEPAKLAQLNAIIHPAVRLKFESWVMQQKEAPYVLKEAALIYESGSDTLLNAVIVVTAPEKLRIERIAKRDQLPAEAIRSRMKNQWPEDEKIKRAKFIINNDEQKMIIPQVLSIHRTLLNQSSVS